MLKLFEVISVKAQGWVHTCKFFSFILVDLVSFFNSFLELLANIINELLRLLGIDSGPMLHESNNFVPLRELEILLEVIVVI